MDLQKRQRLCFPEVLRAGAFALIILYHFMIALENHGIYSFSRRGFHYGNANMHMATLGVSLFFILSGLGLMYSHKDSLKLKSYYRKRFVRILLPFYIVDLFYICFCFLKQKGLPFDTGIAPWKIIFTLFGMDEYVSMLGMQTFSLSIGEWFLGCIVIMYILFPLLRTLMLKHPHLMMLLATVYIICYMIIDPSPVQSFTDFFGKIYDFILGMYLGLIWQKINRHWLFVTVPLILLYLFCPAEFPIPEGLRIPILSAAVVLSVIPFEKRLSECRILNRILAPFSKYSYEIFLVHHAVIIQWTYYFLGHILTSKIEVVLLFVTDLFFIAVLSLGVRKLAERLTKLPLKLKQKTV